MNYAHEQTFYNCWLPNLGFIPVRMTHSSLQYAPFQFVYKLIEVVEDKNVLLQNGDGFNGAAHALKDTIRGQIQCCILKYP